MPDSLILYISEYLIKKQMFIIFLSVAQKENNRENNGLFAKSFGCEVNFMKFIKSLWTIRLYKQQLELILFLDSWFKENISFFLDAVDLITLVGTCNFSCGVDIQRPICAHKLKILNEYIYILLN